MFLELYRSVFKKKAASSSETAYDFTDAFDWIVTYRKAEEYDTSVMASRELILKVKTGITYYANAEKKVASLASSNIDSIVPAAKAKLKVIETHLKHLRKWEEKIRDEIKTCESLSAKKRERMAKEKVELEIRKEVSEIEALFRKRNYTEALHMAKRFASVHVESKKAMDILFKAQRLNDKFIKKESGNSVSEKKLGRFFQEMGIKPEQMQEEIQEERISVGERFFAWYETLQKKRHEHEEYLRSQKSLRNIEKILLETGSISKISNIGGEQEIEILSVMESGLTKNISDFGIDGYHFFGKILGKEKIVGDTFGFHRDGSRTVFYFGDATGHGVQAGFTVSLLSKIFSEQVKKEKNFIELFRVVNNELKSKLNGRIFVTCVFFEHDSATGKLRFIGAGHDPMYIYRGKTHAAEKVIPGGLALGVRIINNTNSIRINDLAFEDGDMLIGYTDGIIEARNAAGELYGFDRLEEAIRASAKMAQGNISRMYDFLMGRVYEFIGKQFFMDDVSCFIFLRDSAKDLIMEKAKLDELLKEVDGAQRSTVKIDYQGKTREEIIEIMRKDKHMRELKARMTNLEQLYKIGEYGRLKQEITTCYKQGFVHERMKFFLEKIIKNEEKTKILKLEERLQRKYEMLQDLFDKGEYAIVIREARDVIYKNGNL